ncbi:MAG: methionine synthase [bacterium]|nr:methionine synthase [bacterium]
MSRLTRQLLGRLAADRILILDGAMGTMIQSYSLDEAAFRGALLKHHPHDLKGNNDILNLTQPQVISEIYRAYLEAGADIITTNTFNGTSISQSDYHTDHLVRDINLASARLAREAADEYTRKQPDRPRFVAGSLAPTNRTCSISPDVNDPGLRNITFMELVKSYSEEAEALLDGGADLLLIETIFDPLNSKAAVFAVRELLERRGTPDLPVWISGTIVDTSGRTLTGQTAEAFCISLRHADAAAFGLNCALGARALRPFLAEVSQLVDTLVSVHPNAGLPNELGGYDETPAQMAAILSEFAADGLVNIVGGCCGTTPAYIKAIDEAMKGRPPRRIPEPRSGTFLAGLEALRLDETSLFVNIGERTNVAGSKKFARLIREGRNEEALEVARQQVQGGAQIIDVNMDDAMLEAPAAMTSFLNMVASDPEISRVPVMVDSSDWNVLEAGLRCLQGKGVVNSLSLKDGEDEFRRRARLVRSYGAAAVIMAFDEQGQADTLERRLSVCRRAWDILTREVGFPPEDIIFDPNVFAVATGLPEHDRYAVDYIEACRQIKATMPGARVSGGISNLSFAFRGNDHVREAMHSVFLYHAIKAGLDMGIVNAGQLAVYEDIEPSLLEAVEDVILARRPDAAERLLAVAAATEDSKGHQHEAAAWRTLPVAERLAHALLSGDAEFVEDDTLAALQELGQPLAVIEGPLMAGMNRVGELFGAGKMFLPQVIRSARVMKRAVAVLDPYLQAGKAEGVTNNGRVLLATVKGDVHDIGKNIVGVVLGCNNYEIIDLGVMVPADRIIATAIERKVDIIGLSGLITPSLGEMVQVAKEMTRQGLTVPLLIGGATTSRVHTAVKIDPHYAPGVVHVLDASRAVGVVGSLISERTRVEVLAGVSAEYAKVRHDRGIADESREQLPLTAARAHGLRLDWTAHRPETPRLTGVHPLESPDLAALRALIDWTPFFQTWRLPGKYPRIFDDARLGVEARRLFDDAQVMLDEVISAGSLRCRGVWGLLPAAADGDDLVFYTDESRTNEHLRVPFLRQQRKSAAGRSNLCLTDFVAPVGSGVPDWAGAFVVTAGLGVTDLVKRFELDGDDYRAILAKSVADRLAEAFAEYLHLRLRREWWGYAADENLDSEGLVDEKYRGIRPAPGYPACPDHVAKKALFALLGAEAATGARLTESCAIDPAASVAGWYFGHPEARYFGVGRIGADQVADYAARTGLTNEEATAWLAANLD